MQLLQIVHCFILLCAIVTIFHVNASSSNDISAVNGYKKSSASNGAMCVACKVTVLIFRSLYWENRTHDSLMNFATFICQHFVRHDSLICYGLAKQFREELLYVIDKLIMEPHKLCSMFVHDCGHSEIDTSTWNIALPPKKPGQEYPTYPVTRKDNLRVLHITDLHLDPQYAEGSEAYCKSELCCHSRSGSNGTTIIQKSGYWGTVAACDIPDRTIKNMLQNIRKLEKIDYIMLGGDYIAHTDWTYTKENHLQIIRNISMILRKYFPNTPIYWTLGNHEGVPVNSFAPHYIPMKYRPQWLYDEMLEQHKVLLDKEAIKSVKYRGSYSVQLYPGLKLISLNSGYCETSNFWIYINETDPDGTLSWLVTELHRAENDGQYVHILSHIPPGDNECIESWARNYYRIIARFSKTIQAQFFGHIHVDSFTVFYENMNDDASKPISVLYATPSVTTFKYLNPAFRIYEIEPGKNYRVINFHTYFLNLTKIGLNAAPPTWEVLYSAKEEYGLNDLSPMSWDHLINRITYNKSSYDRFIRNSNRREKVVCEEKCRYESLCFLRKGHHNMTLCEHLPSYRYRFLKKYFNLFESV